MSEKIAIERIADALESASSVLVKAWAEEQAKEAKGNPEWVSEWFVRTHERGDIRCKDERLAHETARYWVENSTEPDSVEVFVVETQRWPEEPQGREYWLDDDESDLATEDGEVPA